MRRLIALVLVLVAVTAYAKKFDCDQLECNADIQNAKKKPTYCGRTGTSYNGSQGGYDGTNAICAAAFSGCHVCSSDEVLDLIVTNGDPSNAAAWINMGPPGYQIAVTNDCAAWLSTSAIAYGRQWKFNANATGGRGSFTPCDSALPFHCCK